MAKQSTAVDSKDMPISDAGKWLQIIETHESLFQPWRDRCRKIEKIYTEQRRTTNVKGRRRYAMLWANVSTLQPTIYARVPKPVVMRRFKDQDKVARTGGELIERGLIYNLDKNNFDAVIKKARDDLLLYSRGVNWSRYDATFQPLIDPATQEPVLDENQKPQEQIATEQVITEFVQWYDFGHGPGRTWEEVACVWRRAYMDRSELIERFGEEKGKLIPLDHGPKSSDSRESKDAKTKATIYEVWDKTSRMVYWVARGYDELCDTKPPLVDLEGFFPCPKPMYGTLSTDSLIPIPDYVYYQDQAEEIDEMTNKIDKLLDSLKLVGFYPAGTEGTAAIIKAMKPDSSDLLVPVAGWNAFSERGGASQIQWVPIDIVIKVLQGCYDARDRLIQDIYQIMGLSDIQRGQTDPNETAAAQSLKSQYGSIRTQERQGVVQNFARDTIRIIGEIMAEKFQPETLLQMTGMKIPTAQEVQAFLMKQQMAAQLAAQQQQAAQMQPTQPGVAAMGANGGPAGPMPGEGDTEQEPLTAESVTVEQVFELLHNDKMRGYRIDIETDSTIAPDEQADKQSWNEMLVAVSTFLQQAMPMGQAMPEFVPVLGEMLQATVRKYRAGRSLEDSVESAITALMKKSKTAMTAPPQPDPAALAVQAKTEAIKTKGQIDIKLGEQKMQMNDHQMAQSKQDSEIALFEAALALEGKQAEHVMNREAHHNSMMNMKDAHNG